MRPKIIIKRNLIIFRKTSDWEKIWRSIQSDYGAKICISYVLKRELGFTIRAHTEWIPFDQSGDRHRKYAEEQVHLDFYNESAQSWFLLRYVNNSSATI